MTQFVIGPDGAPITRADLPPGDVRWTMRRKAEVIAAIRGRLLSIEEASALYKISVSEFLAWERLINKHGEHGLRATRVQQYRV